MIAIGKRELDNGELLVLDLVDGKFTNEGMMGSVGKPAIELSIRDVQDNPDWMILNADLKIVGLQGKITRLVVNDALIWEAE